MPRLPSGLPDVVEGREDLARFLIQSNHYTQSGVRPIPFLPNPKDQSTSVSRQGLHPVEALKRLGKLAAVDRNLHGAAIFKAEAARKVGLNVTATEPPDRHALLTKWPWLPNNKKLQKEKAIQLSVAAGKPVIFDQKIS